MAEFVHNEAMESDNESIISGDDPPPSLTIEGSIVNNNDGVSEEEEEEEVEDVEEQLQPSTSSSEKRRRKKSGVDESSDEDDRLMEDDYELLEENLGIRFKKKFKRVKIIDDEDSDEEQAGSNARNQIADELFDLDDEPEDHRHPQQKRARSPLARSYSSDESSEDEIDDFIVDDSGAPIRRVKTGEVRITDHRLQDAQDIFGVDFDMDEFNEMPKEDEYEDSEEEDEQPRRRRKSKSTKKPKELHEIFEPSDLERLHFTKKDAQFTRTDVPERIQRRNVPTFPVTEFPIKNEASWIFDELQKLKKQLGKAYENEDLEDPPLEFNQELDNDQPIQAYQIPEGEVVTNNNGMLLAQNGEWEDQSVVNRTVPAAPASVVSDWGKETVIQKPKPAVAATNDEEEWETSSFITKPPAVVNTQKAPATADDDEWETSSFAVKPTAAPTPAPALNTLKTEAMADEEEWETSSFISKKAAPTSAPPKAPAIVESNDWETGSILGDPERSDIGSRIILETSEELMKNERVVDKIEAVLKLMKFEELEVPYIKRYKKDTYMPELTVRDLWNIWRLDAIYCQLHKSKHTLMKLLSSTMEFLEDESNNAIIDTIMGKSVRGITASDFDVISELRSVEDINDFRSFYSLYYGPITPEVKAYVRMKGKLIEDDRKNWDGENDLVIDLDADTSGNQDTKNVIKIDKRPPQRRQAVGRYENYKQLLEGFLPYFGMSATDFAVNVRDAYAKISPIPSTIGHLDAALPFTSHKLPSRELVIESASFVMATQISRELEVRKVLRGRLLEKAAFTVTPTEIGKKSIDESHPLFSMKYLRNKPIHKFIKDEFLKLMIGEQEKLVEIRISQEYVDSLKEMVDEWIGYFSEDGFSSIIEGWNAVKRQCVEQAVFEMILPSLVKELKMQLEKNAQSFVIRACRRKLRKLINVGKFQFSADLANSQSEMESQAQMEWSTDPGLRVMGLAYDSNSGLVPYACVLNPDASVMDHLALNNIILSRKPSPHQLELKEATVDALRKFIRCTKPHAIVVGGENVDAYNLEFELKEIIEQLHESDEDFPLLSVEIMDNNVAKIFSYCSWGASEFRESPVILRQAISLARRLMDPLVEIGQLFNTDEDILCLKLHPLQNKVFKEQLLDAIEEEFVSCVNEVGLDFNRCLADNRTAQLLKFIAGLGPSKASFLRQVFLRKSSNLKNRSKLVELAKMGPVVFRNCAGFIKVMWRELIELSEHDDIYIEYLDCTRVHPDYYELARQIANDAFAEEDEEGNPIETNMTEDDYVKKALDDPVAAFANIGLLNMAEFAEQLKAQNKGYIKSILDDIADEYYGPFKDPREPYTSPSVEEVFSIVTKETPETLYRGKLLLGKINGFDAVGCKVPQDGCEPERIDEGNWKCPVCKREGFKNGDMVYQHYETPRGVYVTLDNGLKGYINAGSISDQIILDISQRVRVGQPVHCRVLDFSIGTRKANLTSKTSDLRDEAMKPRKDHYYDRIQEAEDESKVKKKPQSVRCTEYRRRAIAHPAFHNISYTECAKRLESMEVGDAIFRPSSKGINHITLTWKVMNGQLQHVDIVEHGKTGGIEELGIGPELIIDGDEKYEDLDEILTRYVYRLSSNVREIINHKYYVDVSGSDGRRKAEEILMSKLRENSYQLHYVFSIYKQLPGRFLLSYLLSTSRLKYAHEVVTVVPDGYRYRGEIFEALTDMMRYFKLHYRRPPSNVTPGPSSSISSFTS